MKTSIVKEYVLTVNDNELDEIILALSDINNDDTGLRSIETTKSILKDLSTLIDLPYSHLLQQIDRPAEKTPQIDVENYVPQGETKEDTLHRKYLVRVLIALHGGNVCTTQDLYNASKAAYAHQLHPVLKYLVDNDYVTKVKEGRGFIFSLTKAGEEYSNVVKIRGDA